MVTKKDLAQMRPRDLDDVPVHHRTDARDACREYIETLRTDEETDWPLTMTQMAEQSADDPRASNSGWSRQHFANVIEHYYILPDKATMGALRGKELEIPDDVTAVDDYLRGLADGWALREEHPE